ncbi:gas vesicle protein GvpA [Natronococcus pandeyae]|uniref:Gas vesicle protein GvpA n=1 Tax=Natronococcus pandeyae TaxID=2055836 RepID=A0A8J8Q005_9EURY|nr:gas vesicle protein [Natronococcus pandeyae]TYL36289.1 gas vesicle protein GvpA [Natronococcus pandeyae]
MVDEFQPSRQKADLAEVVEMLLDKGIVINADIAVSIGDTQLLGIQVRAAIASFETAAKYGLEFPEGTDMRRLAEAVDEPELAEMERPNPAIDPTRGVNVTPDPEADDGQGHESDDSETNESDDGTIEADRVSDHLGATPDPEQPTSGGFDLLSDDESEDERSSESNEGENDDETTESDTENNEQ